MKPLRVYSLVALEDYLAEWGEENPEGGSAGDFLSWMRNAEAMDKILPKSLEVHSFAADPDTLVGFADPEIDPDDNESD